MPAVKIAFMTSSQTPAKYDRLVWIDLEMTGLDPKRHTIVEIAAIITDADLNVVGEGLDIVIHATDEELAQMDDFVTNMHNSSGLTEEIKAATTTLAEAETAILELIEKHCAPEHPAPLAGNSIATDRAFIREYMPRLDEALHYRMIDVSTIKELARRWHPRAYFNQPAVVPTARTATITTRALPTGRWPISSNQSASWTTTAALYSAPTRAQPRLKQPKQPRNQTLPTRRFCNFDFVS